MAKFEPILLKNSRNFRKMIKKLTHRNRSTSEDIRAVFQISYAVEAELLQATDFPPLKRPLEAFTNSDNQFFGYYMKDELAAVMEIDKKTASVHIQSLVVQPKYFRKGIGRKLVAHAFEQYQTPLFTVETGLANEPATQLYLQMGFSKVLEYDTEHGIRKVRFEKVCSD